jgi:hypothetical protein
MTDWLPGPWEFTLLALAAWRVWVLLAIDKVLDPVRDRLLFTKGGDPRVALIDWVECPYCFGFWVVLGWWSCWMVTDWTVVAAVPFALSATVAVLDHLVDWLRGE